MARVLLGLTVRLQPALFAAFLAAWLASAFMVILLMNNRKIAPFIGALVFWPSWILALQGPEVSGADNCQDLSDLYQQHTVRGERNLDNIAYQKFDGVVYRGVIKALPVTLEIIGRGDRYRLSVDGLVTLGELNTERGFEQDENASLFILNWQQPKADQIRFVKLSKDHSALVRVDANGQLNRCAILRAR
ncbi:MAG: hypothetical protein ACRC22_00230 [Shewanella sp.]